MWSLAVWIVTMFRLYVIFFPTVIAPFVILGIGDLPPATLWVLVSFVVAFVIGFVSRMFNSKLEMKKARFKVWSVRFLKLNWLYCIVVALYGLYKFDYKRVLQLDFTEVAAYLSPIILYFFYRKVIIGKWFKS